MAQASRRSPDLQLVTRPASPEPLRRFPTFRKESCMRSPRAGMVGIEYHRALSGISHGEGAIVGSAASGPHALWRGGGRGVIRRGVAGSVPVPECRGRGRRARRRGGVRGPGGAARADGPGRLPARLADPNDVEDAFQATFLVLVRRARSVRVGDSLGRWLYGVARRVAAKAQARPSEPACGPNRSDANRSPRNSRRPDRALAALDEEVSRLPEKYLAPVVLCDLEGLTHAEAAARLAGRSVRQRTALASPRSVETGWSAAGWPRPPARWSRCWPPREPGRPFPNRSPRRPSRPRRGSRWAAARKPGSHQSRRRSSH